MSNTDITPPRTKRGLDPQTAAELADLLHEISSDPKSRKLVAQAIKAAKPDSPHAGAFKDVEIEERFETLRQEQADQRIKDQQAEIVRAMNAKRQGLLDGSGGRKYGEDDIKKIEALMERKGIVDYDDGATLYAATLPPVEPKAPADAPPQHGATWEFPEMDKFGKDPVKASRDIAHQMIGEFMRKRG